MRLIPLTQGKFSQVDDYNYDYLNMWNWFAIKDKNKNGKELWYAGRYDNGRTIRMHIEILGRKKGNIIDHKDGNGLNNQESNIRHCTYSQNNCNRKSSGKSCYLGVTNHCGKFNARIRINGKRLHLGEFENEIDAAKAYDYAAIKYHGEFAKPNFV